MSAARKPKPAVPESVEYDEVVIAGKTIRLKRVKLMHPFKEGDAVKLVRQARGYRH